MAKRALPKEKSNRTFEFGLVMAGAVSAGAYTAGVIDFLIEALDAWYMAKANKIPECPPHNVKLKVMSGASAGAMTAGITAAALGGVIDPVRDIKPYKPGNNKLYKSWVQQIDIEHLLGDHDLQKKDGKVKSLLDSTILEDIAKDAFTITPLKKHRAYLSDPLDIYLSITNLRGVPYNIGFRGATEAGHELSMRADYIRFQLSRKKKKPGSRNLNPNNYDDPAWHDLAVASLASGAFPVGLAPRVLTRNIAEYSKREWQIPTAPEQRKKENNCFYTEKIDPAWPEEMKKNKDHRYTFVSVDGGVLDNEPLELARKTLARSERRNKRSGKEADRAVILIDPFPHDAPFDASYEVKEDIFNIIPSIMTSLRNQARFKPEELKLAQSENVYSRFLIAPKRRLPNGNPASFPIASGALGGFGGFLSLAFREHDYQLGRRNCQLFLKKHFTLPYSRSEKNQLFDNWTSQMIKLHRIKEGNKTFLPVIPLMGTAAGEVPPPPWPAYPSNNIYKLDSLLSRRADALVTRFLDVYIHSLPVSLIVKPLWKLILRRRFINAMLTKINQELELYEFN